MAEPVDIVAGPALRSLWGQAILVDGHRLQIADDGQLAAPAPIADRLLAQSGWAKQRAAEPADEPADPTPPQQPLPIDRFAGRGRRKKRR